MQQINSLKGIQIKDATIAKLLAEAEEKLKGDTKGYTKGLTSVQLPALLGQIMNPDTGIPFVSAKAEDRSPQGAAAINEAVIIIGEVGDSMAGQRGGSVENAQRRALSLPKNKRRIADAVAAVPKVVGGAGAGGAGGAGGTGGAGAGGAGSQAILNRFQQTFNPRRPSSVPVSVP